MAEEPRTEQQERERNIVDTVAVGHARVEIEKIETQDGREFHTMSFHRPYYNNGIQSPDASESARLRARAIF